MPRTERMRIIKLTTSEDIEFSFIAEETEYKPILISVVVRCQLCRKLSLFHVALQISTHAFVYYKIILYTFSADSFLGLPERGKFATEPVRRSFLIMRVIPERLATKPSPFKVFNIPAGWRAWLWRSSIRVLTQLEYFGMITT